MRTISRKVSLTAKGKFDQAHVSMLLAVLNFTLTLQLTVTQTLTALYNFLLGIQTNMNTVQALRNIVRIPITGYAEHKKAVKGTLVTLLSQAMNAAYSYAIATNNQVLAKQMQISPAALMRMATETLADYAGGAIAIIGPLATAGSLTDYNVTPATMTALQAVNDQYNLILSDPKVAIANRVGLNSSIYELLRECMVTLTNQCDTLVLQFRDTNNSYFMGYWSARKLNEHHLSTQGRFYVVDQDGHSVPQGEVFIIGTDRSAFLDENGYALVDHIPFGEHEVTLSTPWGTNNYGPFRFKKGKSLTLHFQISINAPAKVKVTEETVAE